MEHTGSFECYLRRRRAKILLLGLLILLAVPLAAKYQTLHIVNSKMKALSHVRVVDKEGPKYSDENGNVLVNADSDLIHLSRLGYQDLKIDLRLIEGSTVVMEKQEIQHPVIRVREREYRNAIPALDAKLIHPDTNSSTMSSSEMLLNFSSFASSDNRLVGERQTISLLGSLSRHTLVMLDGVAMNTGGEAFDFSKIPVSQIERIEIIKGNASAYGGSAAMGGIVNIVTKAPQRSAVAELGLKSHFASYDMSGQEYQLSLMQKALSLFAQYRHYYARNDFTYYPWWDSDVAYTRKHNSKTSDNLYLKANYGSKRHQLEYRLSQGSFIRQLPGPTNFLDLYDDSRMSGTNWYHSLMHNWQYKVFTNEIRAFHNRDFSTFKNLASSNPANPNKYSQEQIQSGLQNTISLNASESNLDFLAEGKRLEYCFRQYSVTDSGFSEVLGKRDNLALGLRMGQKYQLSLLDAGSQLSIRGDFADERYYTWRAEQEMSYSGRVKYVLGANIGTAFSLPSLYDMYWIGDSETLGNPELRSESSWAYSLRAALEGDSWHAHAAYYHNEIDNLIQWRQIFMFGSRWQPFNVGTARIRNLEFSGNWQALEAVELSGELTVTDAKDYSLREDGSASATYGKYLTYTPLMKANLNVKYVDQRRLLSVSWNYTGEQYSTIDNAIKPLAAFDTVDMAMMQKFTLLKLDLALDLKLKNIFDKRYEIYAYTPQPGFNWSCGLTLSYHLQ